MIVADQDQNFQFSWIGVSEVKSQMRGFFVILHLGNMLESLSVSIWLYAFQHLPGMNEWCVSSLRKPHSTGVIMLRLTH